VFAEVSAKLSQHPINSGVEDSEFLITLEPLGNSQSLFLGKYDVRDDRKS
jgi:hypothetical protein